MVLLACCCLACGASQKARLRRITNPDTRVQFRGFSVLPPQGPAWSIAWESPDAWLFHRRIESRTHTFMAEAIALLPGEETPGSPEAFVDSVRRRIPGNWDPDRFEDLEHTVSLDASAGAGASDIWCARIYQRAIDRQARQAPGTPFIFEQYEIVCLHPDDRSTAFLVRYSERRLPAEPPDAAARAEGEGYLASMRIERLDPADAKRR